MVIPSQTSNLNDSIPVSIAQLTGTCIVICRDQINQVVWAAVARSSFQGRTRGIPGSIPRGNNA
ncbi:hypothetical protein MTR_5g083020 [Medicago truncatula]|uniref:Uncharacterized protein n=1 Tax=Medicago truncatula TaxID=3880 RepID=G7K271_MEDTR|nr:hypothetical protein MTR_5g083020 [Medicago truncatula]